MVDSNSQMLVWCCNNYNQYKKLKVGNHYKRLKCGGLGDRIKALITVKIWAQLFKIPFYINWETENIKPWFEYSDFSTISESVNQRSVYSVFPHKDNQQLLELISTGSPKEIFDNHCNLILTNNMFWKYIFVNPHIKIPRTPHEYVKHEFSQLYTHILKPTPLFLSLIDQIIGDKKQLIIGIQLRTGDLNMGVGKSFSLDYTQNSEYKIRDLLKNIKSHLEFRYQKYLIFITSDYPDINLLCQRIWNHENIIYNDDKICHLDKYSPEDSHQLSKIFIDNYILSQKTEALYGSLLHSGYAQIAYLSGSHEQGYDIEQFQSMKLQEQCLENISSMSKEKLLSYLSTIELTTS